MSELTKKDIWFELSEFIKYGFHDTGEFESHVSTKGEYNEKDVQFVLEQIEAICMRKCDGKQFCGECGSSNIKTELYQEPVEMGVCQDCGLPQ
jgi:hypothetical protein